MKLVQVVVGKEQRLVEFLGVLVGGGARKGAKFSRVRG